EAEAGLKTAEARLAELRAWSRDEEIGSARARVRQARTRYERASDERERMRVLYERGSISDSEWEEAQAAADSAESDLESAEAQLNIAESGPTDEEIAVAETEVERGEAGLSQAQQALEDTEVRAPYDGVITGRYAKAGDYVPVGQDVVKISALDVLEAEMHIPERFAGIMETGLNVEVRVDTHDLTREGTVVAVNQAIDRQTRTFEVKVQAPNEDHAIKAGAFCVGEFNLPEQEDVLAVPREAVIEQEGEFYVWVADNGEARQAFVTRGERHEDYVHIEEGLEEGQEVVVRGFGALAEGDELVTADRE
ncbi:MAG: efflux RND transporter periplasmic adaptor subunit, partial [Candidatus Hydrogenedentota bacterium]